MTPAQIVSAIIEVETGGNCDAKGASGEVGCMQYMPRTWELFSQEVYGEVREITPTRERYVAYKMIEKWLDQGLTASQIARKWNQGHPGACKSGTNRFGVQYDSCAYTEKVIAHLQ